MGGVDVAKAVKIPSKEAVKRATIRDMKQLGVYKPEYNRLIDIYAGLVHEYFSLLDRFEQEGRQYTTFTAAGGTKKSAIVAALEALRKDILQYSDRLCLNPKAFENVTVETASASKLVKALAELDK